VQANELDDDERSVRRALDIRALDVRALLARFRLCCAEHSP
jgi:hypothetical protein